MPRHLLSLLDLEREQLFALLARTDQLKKEQKSGKIYQPLLGRSIGMLFEKRSTRTRVSFEVGIYQLGAQPIYLSPDQMQLSRGEPLRDTARVLSRYLDGLVVRGNRHSDLEELAHWSSIPLVNALTDLYHPCQIISDLFTLQEARVEIEKMSLAFIGDANNVFNSWLNACALLGFELRLASPSGFEPSPEVYKRAENRGKLNFHHFTDPEEAVKGAEVIYTDVWVSMGQEEESERRRRAFQGFQVNAQLLSRAKEKPLVLHCLPAHRGEEISEEVMESYAELIFEQAENRLHTQKAILEFLLVREIK